MFAGRIERSVILPNAHIGSGCVVVGAIIDEGSEIPDGMRIGVDREADARRGDAQAEQARREAREQVAAAWAEDGAAGARLAAAEAADSAAREALRLAKLRYDNELITARDLLSAEDDASHARQAVAAARTGRRAARLAARIAAGEQPLPPRS